MYLPLGYRAFMYHVCHGCMRVACRKTLDQAVKHVSERDDKLDKTKDELERTKVSKASLEGLEKKARARAEGAS